MEKPKTRVNITSNWDTNTSMRELGIRKNQGYTEQRINEKETWKSRTKTKEPKRLSRLEEKGKGPNKGKGKRKIESTTRNRGIREKEDRKFTN